MTGGIGAMKNTLFDVSRFRQIPREQQIKRMKAVIREELTELQRDTILAYYFENKNLVQIAQERNVNKSTVCRTLKRAENKLRRFLQY
jgi:RNA polymerase sigma factor (sigma-70 family)